MREIPLAREEKLVVNDLFDEAIVYDQVRHRICYLDPRTAFVWRHCNGQTAAQRIAKLLEDEFHVISGEDSLMSSLTQLERLNLLKKPIVKRAKAHAA